MKSVIKLGMTAAVSFVLGYVFSNQRNESYYLVEAQRAAEAIEEENEKIVKGLNKEIAELKERLSNYVIMDNTPEEIEEAAEAAPSEVEAAAQAALVDYRGGQREFYARHQKIAEEVKVDPTAPETATYMITEEEYRLNQPGYDQIPLMYYSGDNVLATVVGDNPVTEPGRSQALGPYDVSKMEIWEEYPALFLRNDALRQDYEIDHMQTSFSEEVG